MRDYMQDNYKENDLRQLILSTISAVGMETELKKDECGINMSYNFIGDYVGFDEKRLVEAWKEMQADIPFEQYVTALTMHELGHAIDREALQASLERTLEIIDMKSSYSPKELYTNINLLSVLLEEHVMVIAFEETAWRNAKYLNEAAGLVDDFTFEFIKKHSLATYKDLYEEDLSLYNKLLEERSLQPV
jgi:hypothetical protein